MYHAFVAFVIFACSIWALLGNPLPPSSFIARLLSPIDRFIVRHVKHPRPFYLFSGILIGFLLEPQAVHALRIVVEKRPDLTVTPEFLTGFGARSTQGAPFLTEWISLVVRVGNAGAASSSAIDWGATIETPDGRHYRGIIKDIVRPVCFMTASGTRFWVEPADALYRIAQHPVDPGSSLIGILQFEMENLPAATIPSSYALTLWVRDINGDKHTLTETFAAFSAREPALLSLLPHYHEGDCPTGPS